MATYHVLYCLDPKGNLLKNSGAPYRKISDIGNSEKQSALQRTVNQVPNLFALAVKDRSEEIVNAWKANSFKICYKQDTNEVVQTPNENDYKAFEPKS